MRIVAQMLRAVGIVAAFGTFALGQSSSDKSGIRINLDAPQSPAKKPATPPAATKSNPTAKPAPKKNDKAGKKDEPPAKIEGLAIDRGEKGYLGLQIENGGFKISFYDKEKKPTNVDVSGAVLRWPANYQRADERTMLTPAADGKSLTSEKVVRPQSTYRIFITLLKTADTGEQTSVENYTVEFAP